MGEHKIKDEANKEFLELQKKEGIKLVYIQLLNKAQELAGSLKVDEVNFKDDEKGSAILGKYGKVISGLVKELSAHLSTL